jgi:hypothetical protein
MTVRPRRRTTTDPSLSFNDLSEFLTFIVSILSTQTRERPPTARYSDQLRTVAPMPSEAETSH